jgi:hypothetical protein
MIAPTKTASPSVPRDPAARSPSSSAATTTSAAAMSGMVNRSRRVAHEAAPHGRAGPTPIRNSSATNIGTVTALYQGAPTLIVSPLVTVTMSGSRVPNSTAKVMPRNRTLLSRKADSRLTRPEGRPPPDSSGRRQTSRVSEIAMVTTIPPRNHGPIADCVNEWTLATIPERVRNVPTSVRTKVAMTSAFVQMRSPPRRSATMAECTKAVAVSQGSSAAFSTGSQAQ